MLYLKCKGQVVSIVEDERLADKYINANTVHFEFCERWADMKIVAQFTQGENTYDVEVDEVTNTVTMPNEITAGDVLISAFGVHPITGVRITTIPVKKVVDKSGFVGDGETPIPPTPDLYTQLINHVDERAVAAEEEIAKGVEDYLEKNPVASVAWDNISGKPDSLPNPFALTINDKSYDGSSAVNMKIVQPMNLLDNSDFLNAVNQRGKTSFADSGYFIDRWRTSVTGTLGAMHFSISGDEGLKMVSTVDKYVDIFQQVERYTSLKGKIFTFAAKILYKGQETVVAKTFALGSLGSGAKLTDDGKAILYSVDGLNICIRLFGNNGTANELTIRWAALYEGSYTADTLPPYMPKGYAAELAACQYYATVIEVPVNSRIGIIRAGSSNGILLLNVPTMRKGVVTSFSALSGSVGGLALDNSEVYGATITTYGPVVGNTVNAILNFASNNPKPNTIDSVRNAGTETFKLLISVDL